ncbi:MAG: ABC transporter ATP-binding protein [Bacteroidales bacterium]|jgi:ABC-type Fe3+/spermidine/putrescine transport system ATPase subunit|nr:ABC transporter ATP-binding protein [Bacteroidales bacterium]MCU0408348.1 ABC transporter ATP-binding protein [Bacteroidales bacterium]
MLKLKDINKKLGDFRLIDINLEIPVGSYYVLLGRSGSGKTQLLELIAGLTRPDSGEIWLDGGNITHSRIQGRGTGILFQDYAIFPNMTVFGNIAYSLKGRSSKRIQTESRVREIADELNITGLLDRGTHHLSGGELQRVALARTLITSPKLLLLDEPMASIDASLKDDVKRLLRRLNRSGLTVIHVTHDYREAVSLASLVGVIHNGRIIQEGTPDSVFRKPVNRFVARYAGIRNFLRVGFENVNGSWIAKSSRGTVIRLPGSHYPDSGLLLIRSDDIRISSILNEHPGENFLRGRVCDMLPSESGMELTVDAGETLYVDVSSDTFREHPVAEGQELWLSFRSDACIVIDANC